MEEEKKKTLDLFCVIELICSESMGSGGSAILVDFIFTLLQF